MNKSVRAYRNSATEGATQIDILLACYDALTEQIRSAGNCASKGDIAGRCRYSERALLLIGHLESWVSLLDDTELAASLASFYSYLRAEILQLQLSTELNKFMDLAFVVCETRAAWQKKQSANVSKASVATEPSVSIADQAGATSRFQVSA